MPPTSLLPPYHSRPGLGFFWGPSSTRNKRGRNSGGSNTPTRTRVVWSTSKFFFASGHGPVSIGSDGRRWFETDGGAVYRFDGKKEPLFPTGEEPRKRSHPIVPCRVKFGSGDFRDWEGVGDGSNVRFQ